MLRTARLVVLIAMVSLALSGCVKKTQNGTENLPAGDTLVRGSSAAMRGVQTLHIVIASDGNVADLPIKGAEGDLKRNGDAQGSIQLEQLGVLVELRFVVLGQTMWIKGATGGWQSLSTSLASSIYDPSAILDPDRGIAKVLDTATQAHTEGVEHVGDVDTYRVAASFNKDAVAQLVPGISQQLTGQLWIGTSDKMLRRVRLTVPGSAGKADGTVTITVSNFDAPVNVVAPA